jgi:hypothetical protein
MTITISTHDTNITSHLTITQQHQNDAHDDPSSEDQQFSTQTEQERTTTPVHPDPMVCSARPGGRTVKIDTVRVVDLAQMLDRAVVTPC